MQNQQHYEIKSQLRKIPMIFKEFKLFENQVGGAREEKERLSFDMYISKMIRLNTETGGTLEKQIIAVVTGLNAAKPDFHLNSMTLPSLQRYAEVTEHKSARMEGQLNLARLMEVKKLFRDSTDLFKQQNIVRLELALRGIK